MHIHDLKELLQKGVVRVVFAKADNSERIMLATTHPSVMPPAPAEPAPRSRGGHTMAESHLLVWDTEAEALRSFNAERLLEEPKLIEGLEHAT